MLNCKGQGWKFDGTVSEFDLEVFCREESVVFDDFIKSKGNLLNYA
jgi:hypothetical protein